MRPVHLSLENLTFVFIVGDHKLVRRMTGKWIQHPRPMSIKRFRPTPFSSSGSSCLKAGLGAFADEDAFKLSQSAEDMEDKPATAGGGINRFL